MGIASLLHPSKALLGWILGQSITVENVFEGAQDEVADVSGTTTNREDKARATQSGGQANASPMTRTKILATAPDIAFAGCGPSSPNGSRREATNILGELPGPPVGQAAGIVPRTRRREPSMAFGDFVDKVKDKVSDSTSGNKDRADDLKQRVDNAADTAKQTTDKAADKAQSAVDKGKDELNKRS
jgi:hypothetical protein